jgi:hypothetical protein
VSTQDKKGPPSASPNAKELIEKVVDAGGLSPFAKLMQGRERPHRVITLPGFDAEDEGATVAIVALRDSELGEARIDAVTWLTEKRGMPAWMLETELGQSMLDNEIQSQCLHRALRQARSVEAPFTRTVNEVRAYMEPDQRLALWNEYVAFQHERNPLRHVRDDEELQEIVSAMGKDCGSGAPAPGEPDVLSYFDSASLRSTCRELGGLVRRLTKQLSSLTSPPNTSDPYSSQG